MKYILRFLILLYFIGGKLSLVSQELFTLADFPEDDSSKNVQMKQLYSDKNASVFEISIAKEVAPHFHESHTETIKVLAGVARFYLEDSLITIQKGDFFVIPEKTIHSVEVISEIPLKVISIQAPEFKGIDRHYVAD